VKARQVRELRKFGSESVAKRDKAVLRPSVLMWYKPNGEERSVR